MFRIRIRYNRISKNFRIHSIQQRYNGSKNFESIDNKLSTQQDNSEIKIQPNESNSLGEAYNRPSSLESSARDLKNSISNNTDKDKQQNSSKLSNVMTNLMSSSLSKLESFILQQAEGELSSINNINNNTDNFRLRKRNIPYDLKLLNKSCDEFIDLNNPNHINELLNIPIKKWYKTYPELRQDLEKTFVLDIPLILNFYIRTLPEVKDLISKEYIVKPGEKYLMSLIDLLINFQWFNTASFIIYRMNLPFDKLTNYLNQLLEDSMIFQGSNWTKYLFIFELYDVFKSINPRIIDQLDFLYNPIKKQKFEFLYMIYKNNYEDIVELENDIMGWINRMGEDNEFQLIKIYKTIDIVKLKYPFKLDLQIKKLRKLISSTDNSIINSKYFMSSLVKNFIHYDDWELENLKDLPQAEINSFMESRKSKTLKLLLSLNQINLKQNDVLLLILTNPSPLIAYSLWQIYRKKKLSIGIYDRFIVEAFINCMPTNTEVVKIEFGLLSPDRKMKLIINIFDGCINHPNNENLTDILTSYLTLMNSPEEHTYVMRQILNNLFGSVETKYKFINLLNLLEFIFKNSINDQVKLSLYSESCKIIHNQCKNYSFFENASFKKKLETLLMFLNSKNIDSSPFLPLILHWSKNLDLTTSKHDLSKIVNHFNLALDKICENPKYLYILNPKNYPSRIYIMRQHLLADISYRLFTLSEELRNKLFESRMEWLCSNNKIWIAEFHKKIFTFGILLEVMIRKYAKVYNNFAEASHDRKIWETIEFICGFKWEPPKNLEDLDLDDQVLGNELIKVLEEYTKGDNKLGLRNYLIDSTNKNTVTEVIGEGDGIEEEDMGDLAINDYDNDRDNENDIGLNIGLSNVSDAMLDSTDLSSKLDNEHQIEILKSEQDSLEFNDIYKTLISYKNILKKKKILNKEYFDGERIKQDANSGSFKRYYPISKKKVLLKSYSPIRIKCILLEELMRDDPCKIDWIIRKLHNDYRGNIPISLLHSIMIGITTSKNIEFVEKIDLVKILDKISTIIYSKKHSYLFKSFVRFRESRVSLIDLIIEESKRINGGSLKTLNWAMKKITNHRNLSLYGNDMSRWANELNNMKDKEIGFWNPDNDGRWV